MKYFSEIFFTKPIVFSAEVWHNVIKVLQTVGNGGQPDMKYNVPERVIRDITVLSKEYDIQKVILFGSRARGTNTDRSDIDIAISGGNTTEFGVAIDENVHTLLMFDVVDLDGHISEELQKEIERDGIVVYEKN